MAAHPIPHKPSWPKLGRFWTVPNMLTLTRLLLLIPCAYLVYIDGNIYWVLILCLLAIATDWFDGRVARWAHQVSDWGKVLDPLVDKTGGGLVILALVLTGRLPLWLIALVVLRDVLLVIGGIYLGRHTGYVVMSMLWGKLSVAALALTVLAALLRADPEVMTFCIWTSAVLLVYSFLQYAVRFFKVLRSYRRQLRMAMPAPAPSSETTSAS